MEEFIIGILRYMVSIVLFRVSFRCGLTFSRKLSDLQECHSTSHLESLESKLNVVTEKYSLQLPSRLASLFLTLDNLVHSLRHRTLFRA